MALPHPDTTWFLDAGRAAGRPLPQSLPEDVAGVRDTAIPGAIPNAGAAAGPAATLLAG